MVAGSDEGGAPDSKMLLNKLFEHAPGAVNVRDLKVDAMFVYGKVVTLTGICWSSVLGCICTSPMANSIIIRFAIGEIVDACSEFCHRVLINILCLHVNLVVKYLFSNNYPSLRNDIVSRRLKSSNVSSFCEWTRSRWKNILWVHTFFLDLFAFRPFVGLGQTWKFAFIIPDDLENEFGAFDTRLAFWFVTCAVTFIVLLTSKIFLHFQELLLSCKWIYFGEWGVEDNQF